MGNVLTHGSYIPSPLRAPLSREKGAGGAPAICVEPLRDENHSTQYDLSKVILPQLVPLICNAGRTPENVAEVFLLR